MFLMQRKTGIQAVANYWDRQPCIRTECKNQNKNGRKSNFL